MFAVHFYELLPNLSHHNHFTMIIIMMMIVVVVLMLLSCVSFGTFLDNVLIKCKEFLREQSHRL